MLPHKKQYKMQPFGAKNQSGEGMKKELQLLGE
jgi:hypothetical protein